MMCVTAIMFNKRILLKMGKTYIVLLIAVVVLFCVLVATIIAARFLKRVFEITENYAKGDFSDKMSQKSFGFFQKISNNLNERNNFV